jgi:hypothetical protein
MKKNLTIMMRFKLINYRYKLNKKMTMKKMWSCSLKMNLYPLSSKNQIAKKQEE